MLLRDLGKITNLRFQVRFDLKVNGVKICTYIADASYIDAAGRTVIEDTKAIGFMDATAKFKIKLFNAIFAPQTISIYR